MGKDAVKICRILDFRARTLIKDLNLEIDSEDQ